MPPGQLQPLWLDEASLIEVGLSLLHSHGLWQHDVSEWQSCPQSRGHRRLQKQSFSSCHCLGQSWFQWLQFSPVRSHLLAIFFSFSFNSTNRHLFSQWSGHQVFENILLRQLPLVPQLLHPPGVASHSMAVTPSPTVAGVTNAKPLEHLVFGSHHHAVCAHPPLLRMAPRTLVSCFKA